MRIAELRWTRYAIPFRRPFVTSRYRWDAREGIIIELATDAGLHGIGDVAPLPEFGTADVAACADALGRIAGLLNGAAIVDAMKVFDAAIADAALSPLRCGIETSCLDVLARAAGVSIARLLAPAPAHRVPVNVVVSDEQDAVRAVAAGFRCLKLKAGAAPRESDVARVAAVRDAVGPDVAIRLDANGAWTPTEAIACINAVAPYAIEFVEQPVAAGDLAALRHVRESVTVPIAADEDVTSIEAARRVLAARAADVLVVKPAVVGGLRRAMQIVEMAAAAGASAVITSAMDSGIGVAASLHVAAASYGRDSVQPPRAVGLATLDLLVNDLLCGDLPVADGAMMLPTGPGLGVELDRQAMERYAAGPARSVPA